MGGPSIFPSLTHLEKVGGPYPRSNEYVDPMAHHQQLTWVQGVTRLLGFDRDADLRVIEIGSYDVNGSIRPFFAARDYVGVDFVEGPGVDVVADVREMDLGRESFDLAISCNAFEHDPGWRETFRAMTDLVKPGGFVTMVCASRGFPEHGTQRSTPSASPGTRETLPTYYRNVLPGELKRLRLDVSFDEVMVSYNPYARDMYFLGRKRGGFATQPAWTPALLRHATRKAYRWASHERPSTFKQAVMRGMHELVGASAWVLPDPVFQDVQMATFRMIERLRATVKRVFPRRHSVDR